MTDHVRRIDRILAPEYLDGLDGRSLDELRAMERETHRGRDRDLLRPPARPGPDRHPRRRGRPAGRRRRARRPHRRAADDPRRRHARSGPATTRVQPVLAPAASIEWNRGLERLITDGTLANLPHLTDAELQATVGQLRELERDVSTRRRRSTRCSTPSRTRSPPGSRPTRRDERPHGTAGPVSPPTEAVEARLRDLGEFIRDQRRRDRLSLRKLSELAGISNPYLSQIERGLRKPSAEILQAIAKGLRISAETLYVRAGILDERARVATSSAAIRRRPVDHRAPEAGAGRDLPVVPGPAGRHDAGRPAGRGPAPG